MDAQSPDSLRKPWTPPSGTYRKSPGRPSIHFVPSKRRIGAGEHEEGLGQRLVEVRVRSGGLRAHGPAVQAVVAAGLRTHCEVVASAVGVRELRRCVGRTEPSAHLVAGAGVPVRRVRVLRREEGHVAMTSRAGSERNRPDPAGQLGGEPEPVGHGARAVHQVGDQLADQRRELRAVPRARRADDEPARPGRGGSPRTASRCTGRSPRRAASGDSPGSQRARSR